MSQPLLQSLCRSVELYKFKFISAAIAFQEASAQQAATLAGCLCGFLDLFKDSSSSEISESHVSRISGPQRQAEGALRPFRPRAGEKAP